MNFSFGSRPCQNAEARRTLRTILLCQPQLSSRARQDDSEIAALVERDSLPCTLFRSFHTTRVIDRDRGTPRGATPPTPPGIQVRTSAVRPGSASTRDVDARQAERIEDVIAQRLLKRRVS